MRTNIDIDDKLMAKAMKASRLETKTKTKKAVVEEALQLLVMTKARQKLRDLRGKVQFWDDYDYKAMRSDAPPEISPATTKTALQRTQAKRGVRRRAA